MEKLSPKKKTKLLIGAALAIIVVVATSLVLLYSSSMTGPTNPRLDDPENDVISNEETATLGMIDITHAELEVNEKTLKITINLKGPLAILTQNESIQWNVTIILDEGTAAYEIFAEKNSTQLKGYVVEMMNWTSKPCQTDFQKNTLTLLTSIDELENTKEVQWFIVTSYEKHSGDELIISATDIAPDEGLQTNTLKK
jgi:hypothetical protein